MLYGRLEGGQKFVVVWKNDTPIERWLIARTILQIMGDYYAVGGCEKDRKARL
jgi:hypothetical protein